MQVPEQREGPRKSGPSEFITAALVSVLLVLVMVPPVVVRLDLRLALRALEVDALAHAAAPVAERDDDLHRVDRLGQLCLVERERPEVVPLPRLHALSVDEDLDLHHARSRSVMEL